MTVSLTFRLLFLLLHPPSTAFYTLSLHDALPISTRTTEMRSPGRKRAALAAKPPRARGNHPNGDVALRGAGPDQRDEPADDRPAKKQVHNEYSQRMGFVPADDRGKEIHERRENKKCHLLTPFP